MDRQDYELSFLLRYDNVAWYEDGKVKILDRRIYPIETKYVVCESHEQVAQAIADMVTQSGGPYTAASMGMALAAYEAREFTKKKFQAYMEKAACTLSHARPTTVKKMTAITDRAMNVVKEQLSEGKSGREIVEAIFNDNIDRLNKHYTRYEKAGEYLCRLIPSDGTVMTQCFAETIIGMLLRAAKRYGKAINFICPETRPYYQGARLTASVIHDMGFPVTVICDNMPAYVMKEKKVDVFTSAADVICMDGHIINKIGTFQIALAACYLGIPYFVTGMPNESHPTVDSVVIECRNSELVLESMGKKHTMPGVNGYYPSFDITPPKLCDGVVTDRGVYPAYDLKKYFDNE